MKYLFFFLLIASACFGKEAQKTKPTLYALLAVDAKSDKYFGPDETTMKTLLKTISKQAKLPVKATILTGNQCIPKNVKKWEAKLPKNSDNVVLFYFSGHGFRTLNQPSVYPLVYFTKNQTALSIENTIQSLSKNVNPRLLIVLADACNNVVPGANKVKVYPLPALKGLHIEKSSPQKGISFLFKNTKGVITAIAAQPGHTSVAYKNKGSLFTIALNKTFSFKKTIKKKNLSWNDVFQDVVQIIKTINDTQTPFYKIDV